MGFFWRMKKFLVCIIIKCINFLYKIFLILLVCFIVMFNFSELIEFLMSIFFFLFWLMVIGVRSNFLLLWIFILGLLCFFIIWELKFFKYIDVVSVDWMVFR